MSPVPGPIVSPRPGPPRGPPSRADPPAGCTPKVKNVLRFKLDAKSVPEALAALILILLKFSIDLAHRQNPGTSPHPAPSDTPHPHPIGTPSAPIQPPNPQNRFCHFFAGAVNFAGWDKMLEPTPPGPTHPL